MTVYPLRISRMGSTCCSGSLDAVASNNPIETFAEFGRYAQKDFKCRSNFSPLDF